MLSSLTFNQATVPPVDQSATPPTNPSQPNPSVVQIDFYKYISSFVDLITRSSFLVIEFVCKVIQISVLSILCLLVTSYNVVLAIHDIFKRLLFKPTLDPLDNSCYEKICQFETKASELEAKISSLDLMSNGNYLINLQQINSEISNSSKILDEYLQIAETFDQWYPITFKLTQVRSQFTKIYEKLDAHFEYNANLALDEYAKFVNLLTTKSLQPPLSIQEELSNNLKIFEAIIAPRLYRMTPRACDFYKKVLSLKDQVSELMNQLPDDPIKSIHPLNLLNDRNSCYYHSAIQILLGVEKIREFLQAPIGFPVPPSPPVKDALDYAEKYKEYTVKLKQYKEYKDDYPKKVALQKELLLFINEKRPEPQSSLLQFIMYLLASPSSPRLRSAIFEFTSVDLNKSTLYAMNDPIDVVRIILSKLLPSVTLKWQRHCTVEAFPGIEFAFPPEELSFLPVPLHDIAKYKSENPQYEKAEPFLLNLQLLIDRHEDKETHPDVSTYFEYNPKNGIVIDKDLVEKNNTQALLPQRIGKCDEFHCLLSLPSILVFQFKRFKTIRDENQNIITQKDDTPLILPPEDQNGIIDLTQYCDAPEKELKHARYKLKGYIVHQGSELSSGHFISYVEMNGKYYLCNDFKKPGYIEITKNEFFSNQNAYITIFEHLPDNIPQAQNPA